MNNSARFDLNQRIFWEKSNSTISSLVAREIFKEQIEARYAKLSEDIHRYQELVQDNTCFLDHKMIRSLQYRLQYCSNRTNIFLRLLEQQHPSKGRSEGIVGELTDEAWNLQLVTETHLDSLFWQSSLGMKYFSKTFEAIEWIDPSKFRKGVPIEERRKAVGEILETAWIERDRAIKKLAPRLKKESVEYFEETAFLVEDIVDEISEKSLAILRKKSWESEEILSLKGNPAHILLGNFQGKIPYIATDYSSLQDTLEAILDNHQSKIYDCLSDFLVEENELQLRLKKGLWIRNMYRSADIDTWLVPELPDFIGKTS